MDPTGYVRAGETAQRNQEVETEEICCAQRYNVAERTPTAADPNLWPESPCGAELQGKVHDVCDKLRSLRQELLDNARCDTGVFPRLIAVSEHISSFLREVQGGSDDHRSPTKPPSKGALRFSKSNSSPADQIYRDGDLIEQANSDDSEGRKTAAMEFMPGSIGLRCAAYKRPITSIEDPGADQLSGKRRKLCANPNCATHRHRKPVRTDALKVCDWIENQASDDMLSKYESVSSFINYLIVRVWLLLDGPPEIKMTGAEIRQRLLWQTPLDLEMASVITSLLRDLEEETIFRRPNCPGRHYVDPSWGVMVANGKFCSEASYEHFMYPTPAYDIRTCSIVLTLVCVKSNWSCYAFDFSSNTISIMDPSVRYPVEKSKVDEHTVIGTRLLDEIIYCMRRATGSKELGRGKWTPKMMLAAGRKPPGVNSGILALNCMRWYNRNSVCDPPRDSQAAQTRKDLTFQLLTMRSNKAKPAISELVGAAAATDARVKKKHEPATSQADSSANNESTNSSREHVALENE
ncbi:hypothetical protein EJB05_36395, partial [Eragrostis curvula]